jgi:hypothetical protein
MPFFLKFILVCVGGYLILLQVAALFDYRRAMEIIEENHKANSYYSYDDFITIISTLTESFYYPFNFSPMNTIKKYVGELDPLTKHLLISEGIDIGDITKDYYAIINLIEKYELEINFDLPIFCICPSACYLLFDMKDYSSKNIHLNENQISIMKNKLNDPVFKRKLISSNELKREYRLRLSNNEDSNKELLIRGYLALIEGAEQILIRRYKNLQYHSQ